MRKDVLLKIPAVLVPYGISTPPESIRRDPGAGPSARH